MQQLLYSHVIFILEKGPGFTSPFTQATWTNSNSGKQFWSVTWASFSAPNPVPACDHNPTHLCSQCKRPPASSCQGTLLSTAFFKCFLHRTYSLCLLLPLPIQHLQSQHQCIIMQFKREPEILFSFALRIIFSLLPINSEKFHAHQTARLA